jgi:SRSO17 transposase
MFHLGIMCLNILLKGGNIMSTMEPFAPDVDQDIAAVQEGAAYLSDIERRLAPYFERAELRQRAMAYLRGLLSPTERKNSWQLAEVSGDATPYGFQHLLRRALWDPDAVRDELRTYVVQHLGDPHGVLVIAETGFLKKGQHSAGVARQYSSTAGHNENCQIGVFLGYGSGLGHALLDRELYLPKAWTGDPARCRQAGIPENHRFSTKPQLARQMLQRTLAAGVPAGWVTNDGVYGDDWRLRAWLEAQPLAYVLAISGKAYIRLGGQPRQVNTLVAALPEEGWVRLCVGDEAKASHWDDWRWMPLADPRDPQWRRWLLVRRRVNDPQEVATYVLVAPYETPLDEVVQVAGSLWTMKGSVEAAKREVGLDDYEVRSWTGWYRHITLAMWAYALLTVLRAGAIAVPAVKNRLPPQIGSSLAAFKAGRGLLSR